MREEKRRQPPTPLTPESLEMLALRYVERYATSEARLVRYLGRKLRERGWSTESPAPVQEIVQRLADLRYVDDRSFGEARARGLERRGYGARRVGQELRVAGIAEPLSTEIVAGIDARTAALAYARRRHFGPFGPQPIAREVRAKQFGAMMRAGHDARLAAKILDLAAEDDFYEE